MNSRWQRRWLAGEEPAGLAPAASSPPAPRLGTGDLWTGLVALLVLVFLGAPVGLIWHAVAPHPSYDTSGGHVALLHPESGVFIADDAYLLFIGAALGLLCGIVAWALARRLRPSVLVGLAVGGLGGSFVAGAVGALAAHSDLPSLLARQASNESLTPYLFGVHATAVQLAWPLVAVLVYGILAGGRREHG
jgi:hypothetical protein